MTLENPRLFLMPYSSQKCCDKLAKDSYGPFATTSHSLFHSGYNAVTWLLQEHPKAEPHEMLNGRHISGFHEK